MFKEVKIIGVNMKRTDYITWNELFMGIAKLTAQRSKDPNTQVGACLVSPFNRVLAVGYNGFPNGCEDEDFPWGNNGTFLESKYAYVVHAELNAILNSRQDLKGATLYVTLCPCNECAKAIVQSGIKSVLYLSDKYEDKDYHIAAKRIFESAGVECQQIKFLRDRLDVELK